MNNNYEWNEKGARMSLIEALIKLDRAIKEDDKKQISIYDRIFTESMCTAEINYSVDTTPYKEIKEKILNGTIDNVIDMKITSTNEKEIYLPSFIGGGNL